MFSLPHNKLNVSQNMIMLEFGVDSFTFADVTIGNDAAQLSWFTRNTKNWHIAYNWLPPKSCNQVTNKHENGNIVK